MRQWKTAIGITLLLATRLALGQSQPATAPASAPASAPDNETAATVNGHPFLAGQVEEMVRRRTPQQLLTDPKAASVLAQQRSRYLEMLIESQLLDEEVGRAGIQVDEAAVAAAMEQEMEAYLSNSGLTRNEFEAQLLGQRGLTIAQFLAERVADTDNRASVARKKLIAQRFPERIAVTDDEIKAHYERYRDRQYTRPDQVRASHILVATKDMSAEGKRIARNQAELFRDEARKEGADFAQLAALYSNCPSRARGGDLGFFPRTGMMVEAFAAAAFALDVGQLSDVVESPNGYHIIKVTDKRPAHTLPLEQVRRGIEAKLRDIKLNRELSQLAAELRTKATIVYGPGWEPPSPPAAPATAPATQKSMPG